MGLASLNTRPLNTIPLNGPGPLVAPIYLGPGELICVSYEQTTFVICTEVQTIMIPAGNKACS